ncbi:MAG: hypothetical protein LBU14_04010 [Candidatus Peribacteria bacterium]|nr:hypothetical protein [Candidatus Peribacteria bacterium]
MLILFISLFRKEVVNKEKQVVRFFIVLARNLFSTFNDNYKSTHLPK